MINQANQDIIHLKNEAAREDKRVRRKQALNGKIIPEKESEREALRQEIQKRQENLSAWRTRLESDEKRRDELSQSLKFDSERDAKNYIKNLAARRDEIQQAINDAEKIYNDKKQECDKLNGQMIQLEKQTREKIADAPEEREFDLLKARETDLLTAQARILDEQKKIGVRLGINREVLNGLHDSADKLDKLEKRYEIINPLSETANGQLSGKGKINLETYVQTYYFDRIINRANIRLMKMSDSQYELQRRVEAGRQSKSGLDLDVTDHYNGSVRDVKSLSGGEKFQASLALALGMSDEVQSSAGGVRLDTMFVDEGFGSLDHNALQNAIQTLSELTEGNRLVGIISHVDELKELIDRQIVVTKDRVGGSKIDMRV